MNVKGELHNTFTRIPPENRRDLLRGMLHPDGWVTKHMISELRVCSVHVANKRGQPFKLFDWRQDPIMLQRRLEEISALMAKHGPLDATSTSARAARISSRHSALVALAAADAMDVDPSSADTGGDDAAPSTAPVESPETVIARLGCVTGERFEILFHFSLMLKCRAQLAATQLAFHDERGKRLKADEELASLRDKVATAEATATKISQELDALKTRPFRIDWEWMQGRISARDKDADEFSRGLAGLPADGLFLLFEVLRCADFLKAYAPVHRNRCVHVLFLWFEWCWVLWMSRAPKLT